MKCVYTLRTGRHKRQADKTLLFQYISLSRVKITKVLTICGDVQAGLHLSCSHTTKSGFLMMRPTLYFRIIFLKNYWKISVVDGAGTLPLI